MKEAKKKFDKIADDYENFLSKFSALRKPEKKSAQVKGTLFNESC